MPNVLWLGYWCVLQQVNATVMHPLEKFLQSPNNSLLALCLRGVLWVASMPYRAVVILRNALYASGWFRVYRASVPVISVGNLTAGGTGKTPACVYIAQWFRERGKRVAILSRGYKALEDGANDEARELEELLPDVPHLQSANRTEIAQIAIDELEMEILLLDDGFQHRRMLRDLDIVLLDATNPFGWGHMLPRGLLREPIAGLRRADLVLATRCDLVAPQELAGLRTRVQRIHPKAAWVESIHCPIGWRNSAGNQRSLEELKGRSVVAVCGIGNPAAFLQTLEKLEVLIADRITYPDHHAYSSQDIDDILRRIEGLRQPIEAIVCTGKDLAKLSTESIGSYPLFALQVELQILTGEDVLGEYLERASQGKL